MNLRECVLIFKTPNYFLIFYDTRALLHIIDVDFLIRISDKMRQCSFAFNGTIHKRADLFSWINLFPLRMCNSIASDQPWPCASCVCMLARPLPPLKCLQNTWIRYHHHVTHTRASARQSSFTPICLCSPETTQPRVLASTCCTISRSQTSTYACVRKKDVVVASTS